MLSCWFPNHLTVCFSIIPCCLICVNFVICVSATTGFLHLLSLHTALSIFLSHSQRLWELRYKLSQLRVPHGHGSYYFIFYFLSNFFLSLNRQAVSIKNCSNNNQRYWMYERSTPIFFNVSYPFPSQCNPSYPFFYLSAHRPTIFLVGIFQLLAYRLAPSELSLAYADHSPVLGNLALSLIHI